MPLESDLTIDASKLDPSNISEKTRDYNAHLIEIWRNCPKWHEVGVVRYRRMRENGQTPLPGLAMEREARTVRLPSRDPHRQIPCRVLRPRDADAAPPRAVLCHIHGGGWVMGSEYGQDRLLQGFADAAALVVVSVGYRLAPEHPYPAANEDCADVAEYLVDHAEREHGAPLAFVGGESAGAHLSAATAMRLLQTRPEFRLRGLVLSYGMFNLARDRMPHVYHFDRPLILDEEILGRYLDAFLPNVSAADRRTEPVSPFFADLYKMKLPPACFLCGTLDPLLDDSVMMSTKWAMSGADSILKLYPGAPHGFTLFAPGFTETTQHALDDIVAFIRERS